MSTTMNEIHDQSTASLALATARDRLAEAVAEADRRMDHLRHSIVSVRPTGVLTPEEMSVAVGRTRNYVDGVWSKYGNTVEGRQTRPARPENVTEADQAAMAANLAKADAAQRAAAQAIKSAIAGRDRLIVMVYVSKLLGPSAIAEVVGIDRNHVLRICRKAGVGPAYRFTTRNQYSKHAEPSAETVTAGEPVQS